MESDGTERGSLLAGRLARGLPSRITCFEASRAGTEPTAQCPRTTSAPVHNLGTADNHMAARKAELLAEIRCHRCVAIAQQYVRLHSRHSVRHKYDRVLQLDCPDRPAGPGSPILPDPPRRRCARLPKPGRDSPARN
jgi:hypothetical protein